MVLALHCAAGPQGVHKLPVRDGSEPVRSFDSSSSHVQTDFHRRDLMPHSRTPTIALAFNSVSRPWVCYSSMAFNQVNASGPGDLLRFTRGPGRGSALKGLVI
ncbi:hypothetical protein MJO28_006853 [Puccinia striiformis f. sp. tritici]|uniref:Uncharacterized protein n=2 Tax=Puccinia striiformis TaxID=27350 RepID=A0A2S4VW87_9BASI|nr:hypothetical protein MJO28_006853 [Puccinia striiformis f. sp. tritici]KAI7955425.1 hypothetical protein MJO29_006824 [Puccinia striiformis f. sp. tritici]POW13773.1 hypothetical protein PSTT_03391 [Puccinia striiformis]